MEEKILKAKKGLMPLILLLAAYVLAIVALTGGISIVDNHAFGNVLIAIGLVWIILGWIPFMGVKVLKPQEALVLTLFGKYIGTLKEEGIYYVNPFVSAVNPASRTTLRQSGDVNSSERAITTNNGFQRRSESSDANQEDLAESNDAEQQQAEDQRLPGQSDRNRHCRYLACS